MTLLVGLNVLSEPCKVYAYLFIIFVFTEQKTIYNPKLSNIIHQIVVRLKILIF